MTPVSRVLDYRQKASGVEAMRQQTQKTKPGQQNAVKARLPDGLAPAFHLLRRAFFCGGNVHDEAEERA